ncbi:MAG: NAD(P)-dependent dehydrogenase (short-subunit alcohol dehydrogenase family) [Candidatus Azotimanducaceae bacterium]|jgi:NAD(P)-dependent dehydrogenase (short-subunit alcohol dehydrogenase family)
MKDVVGKVAVITGGASGLGLAMARSFTAAGMKVVIADIEDKALEAARIEFQDTNADVITLKVDVTDREAMQQAADETIAAFGKVHVLCNNAGVALSGNILEMAYKDWDWVMRVNLDGVINGMVTFGPLIKSHGEGGHVVNTASMAGQVGMRGLSVYNTTKFAVVGMSEAMRGDLEPFGIGASVLCPGFVETDIYSSERNRPDAFGGEDASKFALDPDTKISELPGMLPAQVIGDMVLHAIQNDVFYILSHSELKEAVSVRSQNLSDAFDLWSKYRQTHNI